jgi:2-methylisocitrate lyase-like PEP mutase family enzyme
MPDATDVERVFRQDYGRAVATLARLFADIELAEEAVQDAFAAAVQSWPSTGVPPSPAGDVPCTPEVGSLAELAALGVARISFGPGLHRLPTGDLPKALRTIVAGGNPLAPAPLQP